MRRGFLASRPNASRGTSAALPHQSSVAAKPHVAQVIPPQPVTIKKLNKMLLSASASTLNISTNDYRVILCEKTDDVFLFTKLLGNSVAVATSLGEVDGKKVQGLAHLPERLHERDFPAHTREEANELINLSQRDIPLPADELEQIIDFFQPFKLIQLIDKMKIASQTNDKIHVYLGGCEGNPALTQIYTAYIKSRSDLKLCDTVINPRQLTAQQHPVSLSDDNLSTIFGISSNNEVMIANSDLDYNPSTGNYQDDELSKVVKKKQTPHFFFNEIKVPQPSLIPEEACC